jgi:putative hydrolase of the HAD superfamily
MKRFIDDFSVILLDMMGTFMFEGDRFSPDEDYADTYRKLGGNELSGAQVQTVISEVFARMLDAYRDPARYEKFAPVAFYLETLFRELDLPQSEVDLLDRVFAVHETGEIPETHAEAIRQLHQTHRLGVVSNVWCKSSLCVEEFERAGVADLFEVAVFSSDYGINKPSPLLYRKAMEHFDVDSSKIIFVGDDPGYDIAGAKGAGLAAVLIKTGEINGDENLWHPDLVINDLRDLI